MVIAESPKTPTIPITEIEQSAFCQTDEKLQAKSLEEEFQAGVQWQKIPISYLRAKPEELDVRITEARARLGERTVILGHHYQRNEIIRFADFRGDSFKLSQFAASQESAESIIFCGVHFMAETAVILSQEHQHVILPNLTAGCSMGGHGAHRRRTRLLGRPERRAPAQHDGAHHVHELHGGHKGAVRSRGRYRLHLVERRRDV